MLKDLFSFVGVVIIAILIGVPIFLLLVKYVDWVIKKLD